jgi:hypothetical protein
MVDIMLNDRGDLWRADIVLIVVIHSNIGPRRAVIFLTAVVSFEDSL